MAEELHFDNISSLRKICRDQCASIAEDTLKTLNSGWYRPHRGPRINLEEDISFCMNTSILYTENDFQNMVRLRLPVDERESMSMRNTTSAYLKIEVHNCTTLQAAQSLVVQMGEERVGVLNFASAKNPGGGFLKGASAQEESLARSSSLYYALSQDRFFSGFYGYHRRGKTGIYSDRMIYSPRVTIFKDDNGKSLSAPYHVGIVSTAAPNASILQDKQAIENAMRERIKRLLYVFEVNGHDTLLLGAFGCGVFRNDPLEVANTFRYYLQSDRFEKSFKRVIFAVLDPQMCQVFKQVFHRIDQNDIHQGVEHPSINDLQNEQLTQRKREEDNDDH